MQDRFTIRDFLVYFITGLFLLITLLYSFHNSLLDYFQISKQDIKDNPALTVFLLIPILYLLGHLVHGIDLILFFIGGKAFHQKKKYTHKLKRWKIYWLIRFVITVINGYRIAGLLNNKNLETTDFWKKVSKLQYNGKFSKAEYWNLMNDLLKGITLISLGWVIYYLINFSKLELCIFVFLTIIFWYRARHMATNFISTVNYTYEIAITQ